MIRRGNLNLRVILFILTSIPLHCLSQVDKLVDERDGQVYLTIQIDNQIWMAQNLNYKMEDSYCYKGLKSNRDKYGRLYTWEVAMEACPDGWHLPSDKEWKILEKNIGMSKSEIEKEGLRGTNEAIYLKAKESWGQEGNGIDKFGFNAQAAGCRDGLGMYCDLNEFGMWWTSTEHKSTSWFRRLGYNYNQISRNRFASRAYAFSVRCVKDK